MSFDLSQIAFDGVGLDSILGQKPPQRKIRRVRVASLSKLASFDRISEDRLVHRSTRELWTLKRGEGGDYTIERLFDNEGIPIKG